MKRIDNSPENIKILGAIFAYANKYALSDIYTAIMI